MLLQDHQQAKQVTPTCASFKEEKIASNNCVMHYSVNKLMLVALTTLLLSHLVTSFQGTVFQQLPRSTVYQQARRTLLYANGNDEEIAKLEEQLRKLKQEASVGGSVEQEPGSDDSTDLAGEEVVSEAMFLSENWKESDTAESEESGGISPILAAIGLAVVLAVFAQVPIGQEDLSKYSAIKAPTEQIDLGDLNRARQSGDL